ncbi:hypothetical protein HBA54_01865 [Pelagibius litoralis]|uniref:Parvulin-like PPIase n=1 Tax=Pelagibius litoralis TaxID=374515 RepID=A0A967C690_9PROT|nr:peptidylprolyl isomerase [Pelagibius litoralis]NIA67332.1 hypothetical protein [Pelagibius litoralis]
MKRQKLITKIVMIPLFGLLILSFAVWGIGDIFRTDGHGQNVATVGDTVIDQRSYAQEVSREIGNVSRRFGTQLTPEQAQAFGIPQQVLNRLVSRAVLDEMTDRLGLLMTEDQMRAQILENPAFQGATGRFDRNRFAQALQFSNMSEAGFLQILSRDTQRQQLTQAVTEGAVAPRSLTEQLFTYREERRIADYVVIPNDSAGDVGEPDAAAIQETYDSAIDNFMTPEYKAITLVHLRVADAAAEISVSEETLLAEFEARRETLSTPERREITQAVLPDEAAAQALADKIAEGTDFAAAAQEQTGRAPVSLGLVAETELLAELGGPAFQLALEEVSGPIQSPLGWHIVVVSAIEEGEEAELENLREQLTREIAENQAVDIVIEQANRYDDAIAGGLPIEDAAGNLGIESRQIAAIDIQGRDTAGNAIEGLPTLNEFIDVLRNTAEGDTSLLTETLEGDYFVIRIDGTTEAAPRPLDEVREDVVRLWQARELGRVSQERAQALVDRLEAGEDFAALATAEGLTLERTEAITRFENNPQRTPAPALSQQLFDVREGEVVLAATSGSQIVAKLVDVLGAEQDGREERLTQLSDQLASSIKDDIFQQFLASLRQEIDISINQRLIDQTLTGGSAY